MASAKKYFSPEEQKQDDNAASKKSDGGLIEKVIEKVNKKASKEYFSSKGGEYTVPLPEKITPDSNAGSLDDVVQGKPSPGRKIVGNSNNHANPISHAPSSGLYIVGEIFESFRNSMVKNPMSPTYQVARKIGDRIIKESSDSYGILFKEATNIGLYVLIEVLLGKKFMK
jgi:hypothetical protein